MSAEVRSDQSVIDDEAAWPPRTGFAGWLRLLAIVLVNLFAAMLWLGVLAWLIGRVCSDRFAWSQWLWWIPTPTVIVATAVGFALAWRPTSVRSRRLRRVIAWLGCLVATSTYFAVFEHRLLKTLAEVPAHALTVAHWNMTLDNYADIEELMRAIDELDADLFVMTSAPGEVRRRLHEQAQQSEGALTVVERWPLTLVSRLPIIEVRTLIATDRSYLSAVEVDARSFLGRTATLLLVDLPSSPRVPRMATAKRLRGMLDETDVQPDIVVGDFNMTRGSASIDMLFPGHVHAFDEAGHGYAATFPRTSPLYHIDHTLIRIGSGLRALRYEISDHGQSRHRAQKAWIVRDSS